MKGKEKKNFRIKTTPKVKKNKNMVLPSINKNKPTNKNNLKKPPSMNKIISNKFLESFGFRRRAYKTRFLY